MISTQVFQSKAKCWTKLTLKGLLSTVFIPKIHQPVFVLSAPRSGSSYLYEILKRMNSPLAYLRENDPMWFKFFPYQRQVIPTDYISIHELNDTNIKSILLYLLTEGFFDHSYSNKTKAAQDIWWNGYCNGQPLRYIEKTIANCFHLEVLPYLFPDALYIHLVRDPRSCISSMIEGWQSNFFWKRPISLPLESQITHWCYPLPPNWMSVAHLSLEEICGWSWIQHNRYVIDKFHQDPTFRQHYMRLSYEDLLSHPLRVIQRISAFTHLDITDNCLAYLESKDPSWTTISNPNPDKWKQKNPQAIHRVLPMVAPMMQELDYTM